MQNSALAALLLLLSCPLLAVPESSAPVALSKSQEPASSVSQPASVVNISDSSNAAYEIERDPSRPWPIVDLRVCVVYGLLNARQHDQDTLVPGSTWNCRRSGLLLFVEGNSLRWAQVVNVLRAIFRWLANQGQGCAIQFKEYDSPGANLHGQLGPAGASADVPSNDTTNQHYIYEIYSYPPLPISLRLQRQCVFAVLADASDFPRSEEVHSNIYSRTCSPEMIFKVHGQITITFGLVERVAVEFSRYLETARVGAPLICAVRTLDRRRVAWGSVGPQVGPTSNTTSIFTGRSPGKNYRNYF